MSYCSINGAAIVSGTLVLPRVGVWYADLELEDNSVLDGAAKLKWWDEQLILNGTVRYGGASHGNSLLHVVGGSAGLTAAVKPKAYRNVSRALVVKDLLGIANEKMSALSDQSWLNTQLPFWTLMQTTVGSALNLLVELQGDVTWRVLADGKFWFGTEPWGKVDVDYEELSRDPSSYRMDLHCFTPALMPGTTFQGQRVSTVTYQLQPGDRRVVLNFEAPQ